MGANEVEVVTYTYVWEMRGVVNEVSNEIVMIMIMMMMLTSSSKLTHLVARCSLLLQQLRKRVGRKK